MIISIFLEIFELISSCDPDVASWEDDGDSFIVKNTYIFARDYIPEYFEHNKFQSFSRQLNFYGFKKLPNKIIRFEDNESSVGKRVRFYNPYFKRGRPDLLHRISRSTTKKGNQESVAEVEDLKERIHALEHTFDVAHQKLRDMQTQLHIFVTPSYVNHGVHPSQRMANHPPSTFHSRNESHTYQKASDYGSKKADLWQRKEKRASQRQDSSDFPVLAEDFEPIRLDCLQF